MSLAEVNREVLVQPQKVNAALRLAEAGFVGESAAFRQILETILAIATRECSVVITGETGTGKEMVARKIHRCSNRAQNAFVPVDCTSLTGQLFESQLFGHVKGAFTGAISDSLGFFRAADEGTIFLDEIGEVPLDLQAKLLRVLQESCVTPVGSTKSYPINVRILCATNRDLREMVRQRTFRQDLYYRLNVVTMQIPPLRDRRDDILILAEHFLLRQAHLYSEPPKTLGEEAAKILMGYPWPGNVRELANTIERAYVLSGSDTIQPADLPMEILEHDLLLPEMDSFPSIDEVNRKLIVRAFEAAKGRKMAAAKLLGVEHRKLDRMMKKFDLAFLRQ